MKVVEPGIEAEEDLPINSNRRSSSREEFKMSFIREESSRWGTTVVRRGRKDAFFLEKKPSEFPTVGQKNVVGL